MYNEQWDSITYINYSMYIIFFWPPNTNKLLGYIIWFDLFVPINKYATNE